MTHDASIMAKEPQLSPSAPGRWAAFRLIAGLALVGLLLGFAIAFATDERWLVNAKVLLQIGPETAGSRPSMVGSPTPFLAGNPRREDVQTEVELLNSSSLLRRAFEQLLASDREAALGPVGNPVTAALRSAGEALGMLPARSREERALDRWAGTLRVSVVPSSTVLLIECRSPRPAAAEQLLQTMLELYLADHRAAFGAHGLAGILDGYVTEREQVLQTAEARLTAQRCGLGVVDFEQQVLNLERRRSDLAMQVQTVAGTLASARARAISLQRLLDATPAERQLSAEERPNPTHDELELRLATARQELAVAEQQFTPDSPQVRMAKDVVQLLTGMGAAVAANRQAGKVVGRDLLHDSLRDLCAKAAAEGDGLAAELEVEKAAVVEVEQRLQALERGRAALDKAEQDVAEARKDVTQAREGVRLAGIEQVLDVNKVANVTVVTQPNHLPTPLRTFGLPIRLAIVLGAFAFGGGLGIALLLWRRDPVRAVLVARGDGSVRAVRGDDREIG